MDFTVLNYQGSKQKLHDFIFDIPVYQRPYSWDKEQVDVLLQDLYNSYLEDKSIIYPNIYQRIKRYWIFFQVQQLLVKCLRKIAWYSQMILSCLLV